MKRVIDILKYLCSIGAAIVIYLTVMKATEKGDGILIYVIASVFAVALTVCLFFVSSLAGRTAALERVLARMSDDGYEQEDAPVRECPVCHSYIDADEDNCPYCGGEKNEADAYFATEDPDYRGTDYSGEEPVSAYVGDGDDELNTAKSGDEQ